MRSATAGKTLLMVSLAIVVVAAGLVFWRGELDVYAPVLGRQASGDDLNAGGSLDRNVVVLVVDETLIGDDGYVTLRQLARRYALDLASMGCTLEMTDNLPAATQAQIDEGLDRRRAVGETVRLCLN